MNETVTSYKRCELVKFGGLIDGLAVDDLKKVLDSIIESGKYNIVLDMSEVTLLSSKGIWLLVDIQKKFNHLHRGKLALAQVSPRIKSSLKLVGMDEYFNIYDQVVDAIASF